MNSKIETYIGFAIRKGSVVFGVDNIKYYRKKMYLLVYTPTLSQNSLDVLKLTSETVGCPLSQIDDYEMLQRKNCKALAICDKSLANAILENLK
ncbi:MAG: hypothetical protein IJD47_05655 [Clostridia bacterium]|nr:hypothetical protein [Clostridia bacterium]